MPLLETRGSGAASAYGFGASGGVVRTNLQLYVDAAIPSSYSGSGSSWYDLSGNSRNGNLQSGAGYNASNGGSITFDGSTSVVDFGNLGLSLNAFSVQWFTKVNANAGGYACWMAAAATGGMDYITGFNFDMSNPISSAVDIISHEGAFSPGTGDQYPGSTPFGTWFNITFTVDSSAIRLYVNGVAQDVRAVTGSGPVSTQRFILGRRIISGANSNNALNGNISQVLFYDKVLTPAEITQNYNFSKSRYGL
jgi:hypothetical protein